MVNLERNMVEMFPPSEVCREMEWASRITVRQLINMPKEEQDEIFYDTDFVWSVCNYTNTEKMERGHELLAILTELEYRSEYNINDLQVQFYRIPDKDADNIDLAIIKQPNHFSTKFVITRHDDGTFSLKYRNKFGVFESPLTNGSQEIMNAYFNNLTSLQDMTVNRMDIDLPKSMFRLPLRKDAEAVILNNPTYGLNIVAECLEIIIYGFWRINEIDKACKQSDNENKKEIIELTTEIKDWHANFLKFLRENRNMDIESPNAYHNREMTDDVKNEIINGIDYYMNVVKQNCFSCLNDVHCGFINIVEVLARIEDKDYKTVKRFLLDFIAWTDKLDKFLGKQK